MVVAGHALRVPLRQNERPHFYVRWGNEQPGVWFFSLDASRLVAASLPAGVGQLNYYSVGGMRVKRHGRTLRYFEPQ